MKSNRHIRTLLIMLMFSMVACTSTDDSPKAGEVQKQTDRILEDQSNSALTVLDSITLRSKLYSGDVYTLSIYQGLDDTVRIFSNQETPVLADSTWYYTGDGSFSNGTFSVPSGNGKYWLVYFDPSEIPDVQLGGPACDISCNCTECDIEFKNPSQPDEGCKCTGDCPNGGGTIPCIESNSKTPFVIIKAEVLIFNNTVYN